MLNIILDQRLFAVLMEYFAHSLTKNEMRYSESILRNFKENIFSCFWFKISCPKIEESILLNYDYFVQLFAL